MDPKELLYAGPAEVLKEPGKKIHENVHFRNIKRNFLYFQETFPDDGDADMPRAMRVHKDAGYINAAVQMVCSS